MKNGKNLYSVPEIYHIAVKAFRSVGDLKKLRKSGVLSEQMQERVMLAVTSVNQCAMCSYAHTSMALKAGLDNKEIQSFIVGDFPDVPEKDSKAVLFGQYYADRRGRLEQNVWNELTAAYGNDLAMGILASARVIMMGNAMGIVYGSISKRMHRENGDPRSSVFYELSVIVTLLPVMISAALQALFCSLFHVSKLQFSDV